MKYYSMNLNGYRILINTWEVTGFSVRYSAQVSCPVEKCESFYNCQNRINESNAKATVKASLKKHMKNKHG